jgi:hypothetical protein
MTPVCEPSDGMVTCPDCRGKGTLGAFLDGLSGGRYEEAIQCSRCRGVGAIDRQQEEWMRVGGTHRTWRVAQHESLLECATRLGLPVSELSSMEHGRSDPARLIPDTPEVLRDVR